VVQKGLERRFFFVACLDSDIVIPPSYIKLSEEMCILHLTDEIGDKRQGVSISNSEFVQSSIILYWPEFAVFLLYKEEG